MCTPVDFNKVHLDANERERIRACLNSPRWMSVTSTPTLFACTKGGQNGPKRLEPVLMGLGCCRTKGQNQGFSTVISFPGCNKVCRLSRIASDLKRSKFFEAVVTDACNASLRTPWFCPPKYIQERAATKSAAKLVELHSTRGQLMHALALVNLVPNRCRCHPLRHLPSIRGTTGQSRRGYGQAS